MPAEWYYAKGKQKHGPFTEAQLKELAESGELLPTDMVWKQGMKAWVQAGSLTGFFPVDGPPPLPAASSDTPEDWKRQLWNRVWADKLVFLLICLPICFLLFLILPFLFGTTTRDTGFGRITEPSAGAVFVGTVFGLATLAVFIAVVVLTVLRVSRSAWWMKQGLVGRWVPVDANDQELEFSKTTITQGKSLLGTFTISSDRKRLEISANGSVVETWTVESLDIGEFVVTTQQNVTKCYKRYNALGNLFTITPEDKKRWRLRELQHKWEPVDGNGPAIQFTEDGAMIRFDGFAARYTLSGQHPDEVVTIQVNDKESIALKVLSLSRDEMVLTGEGGSVHYKRGVSISAAEAKKRSDAYHAKLKAVGKGVLLTVGAIGAGIAVLGVAAAAGASASGGGTKTCWKCHHFFDARRPTCSHCGELNV